MVSPGTAPAPGQPGGAEGALPIAPVLDLEPAPGAPGTTVQELSSNGLVIHAVQGLPELQLDQGAASRHRLVAGPLEGGLGHLHGIMALHHSHHALHLPVHDGLESGGAPHRHDPDPGILPLDPPDVAAGIGVGLVGDGAGVHHAEVGAARIPNGQRPQGFQLLAHALGVVLVGLTPEGPEEDPERPFRHYRTTLPAGDADREGSPPEILGEGPGFPAPPLQGEVDAGQDELLCLGEVQSQSP